MKKNMILVLCMLSLSIRCMQEETHVLVNQEYIQKKLEELFWLTPPPRWQRLCFVRYTPYKIQQKARIEHFIAHNAIPEIEEALQNSSHIYSNKKRYQKHINQLLLEQVNNYINAEITFIVEQKRYFQKTRNHLDTKKKKYFISPSKGHIPSQINKILTTLETTIAHEIETTYETQTDYARLEE